MDYLVESARTLPPTHEFHSDLVPATYFHRCLQDAITALRNLDKVKKALFYGKDKDQEFAKMFNDTTVRSCFGIELCQDGLLSPDAVINIIHGIVGSATENGELLEALQSMLAGEPLDAVNIKEEVGDDFWYKAILCRTLNFTFDDAEKANIDKLYKRFPDRFDESSAINRDTGAERVVLEQHFAPGGVVTIHKSKETANLGYATTGELIDELRARCEANGTINYSTMNPDDPYDRMVSETITENQVGALVHRVTERRFGAKLAGSSAKDDINYLDAALSHYNGTPAEVDVRAAWDRTKTRLSFGYQTRVGDWMQACFGEGISTDITERCDRLLEETFELVQSLNYNQDRIPTLVEYVYNRPVGEPHQELGGVMVTIAALSTPAGLDMERAAEDELARVWTKVEQIREKQKTKPGAHSPLPGDSAQSLERRITAHPGLSAPYNYRGDVSKG